RPSARAAGRFAFPGPRHYPLVDRPRVTLFADPNVERTDIRVTARFADPIAGSQGTASPVEGSHDAGPSVAVHGDTMVFTVPRPTAPAARLRIIDRDGAEHVQEFDGSQLTIGRAADNDLVLADGRVSRHHARIAGRRGTLVLADLRSTNAHPVTRDTLRL